MSHRLTILGCGPSGGVPRIGPTWGNCDPSNPKNRRRRCSVLIERFAAGARGGRTSILVDTSPDLREQLLDVRLKSLDGVLFTHDHADHTHGIDDLRPIFYSMKRRIETYADAQTLESLKRRFQYCYESRPLSGYSPILNANLLQPGQSVAIEGAGGEVSIQAVPQQHGAIGTLGFRVANVAYSPDVSGFPDGTAEMLTGLDVWIVDALRYTAHPSHFSVKQALEWIDRLKPKRAILTHMTTDLDYDALRRELPEHVEPAYDGMAIEFE